MRNSLPRRIGQLLRGALIGTANLIPGISGGTMLVSMGIYDTLINSIANLFHDFRRSVRTLLPYVLGMVLGILALQGLLMRYFFIAPLPTATAFIGLILGGVSPIFRKIEKKRLNTLAILLLIAFFALIVGMAFLSPSQNDGRIPETPAEAPMLVLMGIIVGSTTLVPGMSGLMVLMLLTITGR